MPAIFDSARSGHEHARDHFQKRRFASAVRADERNLLAAIQRQIEAIVDMFLAEVLDHTAAAHHHIARARRLHEVEMHSLLFLRYHDALDFLELLHAILHLFGLRGLVAELLDERFHMRDFFSLAFGLLAKAFDTLIALLQVCGIVALVQLKTAGINLGDAIDHVVHKGTVVAYHDNRAVVAAQKALKPLHAFKVEVVGGLVEQEQVGFTNKQLGERDAHLPASREIAGTAGHVIFLEAQAEQHAAHLRFKAIPAERLIALARTAARGKLLGSGIFVQACLELMEALLSLENFLLARDNLIENGAVFHLDGFLLQIAHNGALGEHHIARIGIFMPSNDLQHGSFARAIRAHQCQSIMGFKAKARVGEQHSAAEAFREMLYLHNHVRCLFLYRALRLGASKPPRKAACDNCIT